VPTALRRRRGDAAGRPRTSRSGATSTRRARDPARAAAVRLDLDVPAHHRAGGRGHRRREDHNGTLKTILTRSLERGQIFAGKLLAAAPTRSRRSSLTGIVASSRARRLRLHPLTALSGTRSRRGRALELCRRSLLVYLMPILAVAAIGLLLSTVTATARRRSSGR
jgi:hypothetical protein